MSIRDELTELSIKLFRRLGDECDDSPAPNYEEDNYDAGFLAGLTRAQEIIRAEFSTIAAGYRKPRTITTVEELDALPLDSVVVDRHGTPRTKRAGDSYMGAGWTHAGNSPLTSRELADGYLMHVAYNPKGHDQ